jgi:hypothetical protein
MAVKMSASLSQFWILSIALSFIERERERGREREEESWGRVVRDTTVLEGV